MRSIFTIHAGEYLVGSYIESKFKDVNVWIPSKDSGIDLLLTNKDNSKTVSLQVKFSKDFLSSAWDEVFQIGLKSCGWWTLNKSKIKKSIADYWIFIIPTVSSKELQFLIIQPQELLRLFKRLKREGSTIQSYLWVTNKGKCWETRSLSKEHQILLATHSYKNKDRDLTQYLNNWKPIKDTLKV